MDDLREAWAQAYSIESMAGHGAAGREIKRIGTKRRNSRLYELYVDSEGWYWYRTLILKDGKLISEEEAIFGRVLKRYENRKKEAFGKTLL